MALEMHAILQTSAGSIPDSYDFYRYLIPTIFIDTWIWFDIRHSILSA